MTHKSTRIAGQVARFQGQELDARYLGFFDLFNQERFYEAHDVLEDLWLLERRGPDGDFYKALIQLAGAFVHLQKGRHRPCVALLRSARGHLLRYPAVHHQLDLGGVFGLVDEWVGRVELHRTRPAAGEVGSYPRLELCSAGRAKEGSEEGGGG